MENIYKTSPAGAVILGFLAIIISASYLLGGNFANNWIFLIYISILIAGAIDTRFGIYAGIKEDVFFETKHFIFKKKIKIADINEILYQPTWVLGEKMKSIYILDGKTHSIKIRMSNGAYSPRTLAKIMVDLRNRNQSIQLDQPARELIKENGDRDHQYRAILNL